MNIPNALMDALFEEYGIASYEELDLAIRRLPAIDIAVFCSAKRKETDIESIINTGTGIFGREASVHSKRNRDSVRDTGNGTAKLA